MKYCTKCGNELIDEAVVCTKCGCLAESTYNNTVSFQPEKDEADVGLIVLSALVPLVGFILWTVKNSETPLAARKYGLTALISVGIETVLGLFMALSFVGMINGVIGSI